MFYNSSHMTLDVCIRSLKCELLQNTCKSNEFDCDATKTFYIVDPWVWNVPRAGRRPWGILHPMKPLGTLHEARQLIIHQPPESGFLPATFVQRRQVGLVF